LHHLMSFYFLLVASLALCGCGGALQSQRPTRLTAGFWFWQGSSADTAWPNESLDVLFVHVGTIYKQTASLYVRDANGANPYDHWQVYGQLPDHLPTAREYWLAFRYERQGVPDLPAASILAAEVSRLRELARQEHLNVAGIQLDIDSPTSSLSQYARFLHEVRKGLPPGFEISITALVDWFRDGTTVSDVIKQTDEFVPQFYDVDDFNSYRGGNAIAAKIDPGRWGPVFNAFGKRFRIGISTFGRARLARQTQASPSRYSGISSFPDLTLIDIATNPVFQLQTTRTGANELVLSYRATQKTRLGYNNLEPGDALQFILATPESVRANMNSANEIGGHLAGVVFFRWPTANETLAMQPDEVLTAAGLSNQPHPKQTSVIVNDGACATVKCVDVFLENAKPFSSQLIRYRIHSSTELEYFLPEAKMPVRMAGPSELDLSLPPYCARGLMYLGRAVSLKPAEFTIEETQ
jgi:hypothetical protein